MVTTKATPGPRAGTQSAAPLAAAVRKNLTDDAQFIPLGGAFFIILVYARSFKEYFEGIVSVCVCAHLPGSRHIRWECVEEDSQATVPDDLCEPWLKPADVEACSLRPCPA